MYCAASAAFGPPSRPQHAGPREADPERPAEHRRLHPPALARVLQHLGVHLLEDARHGAHEGRPDDAQVLDDLLDAAVDRGRESDAQLRRPDHLAEDVREREPEELQVVAVAQDAGLLDRLRLRDPAGVRELDALRPAGRAGRVDEGRERVAADGGGALLELARERGVVGPPLRLELGEREHPPVRAGTAVEGHDVSERR